jgi:hypothetical protein
MLSYTNYELIKQPFSYEAIYIREYRPTLQNEQYILDYVTFFCITADTYVISTIVSLLWFPDAMHTIQQATLFVLFALYAGKEFGEFLFQVQRHCEFVNTQKQFVVQAWEDPNMEYICNLVWRNPDSMFDFRTCPVRVGQRFIRAETPAHAPAPDPVPKPSYNTRSRARIRRAAPVE